MASAITAQLGLLESDLAYRLALLCVNVLQPLKNQYPNIVVTSGLRQPNSGIGQHELGEAVDIQIRDQTTPLIYEVADYIQKRLPFDQLILNFSRASDPWIHVSFSGSSLRQQVLTKDFTDEFHEGLFIVDPLTGEEEAAALRDQQELDKQILAELKDIQTRQERTGQTSSVVKDALADASGSATEATGPSNAGNYADQAGTVACIFNALNLSYGGPDAAFEVTKRVAWLLRDKGAGLYIKDAGDNIVNWNGYWFSAGRICFPDGQLFKVVRAISGAANSPGWDDNGVGDPGKYMPAMDPGTDINTDWLTCPI